MDSVNVTETLTIGETSQKGMHHIEYVPMPEYVPTREEQWHAQREREYAIIREAMMNDMFYDKSLAVFCKFPDGNKSLVAIVYLRENSRNPNNPYLFWFDVTTRGKLVRRYGNLHTNGKLSLPESFMRKMLHVGSKGIHVYAQQLSHVKKPHNNTTRYERVSVREEYRYFKDER